MSTLDLMLPKHLYRKTRNRDGEPAAVTYQHDRLINWFDRGKGVDKLCQSIYENELKTIDGWQEDQLLMLEEQWLEIEDGDDDDDNEEQYHLACDAVIREANERRAVAKSQMTARHSAIEELVGECAEHIGAHAPASRESHAIEYTLVFIMIATLAYVLI